MQCERMMTTFERPPYFASSYALLYIHTAATMQLAAFRWPSSFFRLCFDPLEMRLGPEPFVLRAIGLVVDTAIFKLICFFFDQPPFFVPNTEKAGSKRGQQAVKLSLQQQIDRSRATAKEYDQAYSRDVEVIKSIEESLISVFNKARRSAGRYCRAAPPLPSHRALLAGGKAASSFLARVYGMLQ